MIYAMHQTKVACLVRHGRSTAPGISFCCAGSPANNCCSRRRPPKGRAAATCATAPRRSSATARASASNGRRPSSPTARAADGIVTTARRSADAASSDQVLVAFLKAGLHARAGVGWDAFGMRGTCSEGFKLIGIRFERADPAGELRQDSRPDHDAGRASALERGLGRHRHRRSRPRPRLRPQGRATRRRHAAAGRRASDARQRIAAHAAQPDRNVRCGGSKRPRPIRPRSRPSTFRPA